MLSKKQLFSRGMLDIAPHMLSVIPFGIICGAIGVELGFNPYLVYAMSLIIFGGASQIVFLQLSRQVAVIHHIHMSGVILMIILIGQVYLVIIVLHTILLY